MVFIAELGDKTQFLMLAMASKYKIRDILIGVGAAIGVGLGAVIGGIEVIACGTGWDIPVGVVCLGLAAVCGLAGTGIGSLICG